MARKRLSLLKGRRGPGNRWALAYFVFLTSPSVHSSELISGGGYEPCP